MSDHPEQAVASLESEQVRPRLFFTAGVKNGKSAQKELAAGQRRVAHSQGAVTGAHDLSEEAPVDGYFHMTTSKLDPTAIGDDEAELSVLAVAFDDELPQLQSIADGQSRELILARKVMSAWRGFSSEDSKT